MSEAGQRLHVASLSDDAEIGSLSDATIGIIEFTAGFREIHRDGTRGEYSA